MQGPAYSLPAPPKRQNMLRFIAGSMLLHVALVSIVWLGRDTTSVKSDGKRDQTAITARLIFTPAQIPTEPATETIPDAPEPEMSTSPPETSVASPQETLPEPIDPVPSSAPKANTSAKIAVPSTTQQSASEQTIKTTRQYIQQLHQQAQQQAMQQSSRAFRQTQRSPTLTGPSMVERDAASDPARQAQIKANCANTAAKSVALLSSLLGGMVRCTDNPDLAPFIDKRINKELDN